MKRLLSCSFIFFSAVVCPGRKAVVNSPWKIKLYAATGRQRERAGGKEGRKGDGEFFLDSFEENECVRCQKR